MGPWFNTTFGDFLKPRVCKFLINRYLGQFFEEKLSADQICLDLYNGRGSVSDVKLCCEVSYLSKPSGIMKVYQQRISTADGCYDKQFLHTHKSFVVLFCCCLLFIFIFSHSKLVFLFASLFFLPIDCVIAGVSVERRHKRPTSRPTETKNQVGALE